MLCVSGHSCFNYLTKVSSIPSNKVAITGQPRYDIINRLDTKNIENKIFERYNLNPDKKLILITTQPEGIEIKTGHRYKFIQAILKALHEFSDVQAIIKPHPREEDAESFYQNIISKYNNGHIKVSSKKYNTYSLLATCNLLITSSSTTALEAILLQKPVIILNLSKFPDPIPYTESGAAIKVEKEKSLAPAIHRALFNDKVKSEMAKSRQKFISYHAYQDGEASKRVANLAIKMIEDSI